MLCGALRVVDVRCLFSDDCIVPMVLMEAEEAFSTSKDSEMCVHTLHDAGPLWDTDGAALVVSSDIVLTEYGDSFGLACVAGCDVVPMEELGFSSNFATHHIPNNMLNRTITPSRRFLLRLTSRKCTWWS